MAIGWLDTKETDALADKLVADLASRIPPTSITPPEKKAIAKNQRTISLIFRQAGDFANTHSLNIYKKAKLANRFKWALLEAGYPKVFVDAIAFDLAAVMATKKGKLAK